MIKHISALLLASLLCGTIFAATMDEIEQAYLKGLRLGNQGSIQLALQELQKVVSVNPRDLPHEYYVSTISEAYFNMGVLHSKNGDMEEGIKNYKKALDIMPGYERSLYYLAYSYIAGGEIAEARRYYKQIRGTGVPAADSTIKNAVEEYMSAITKVDRSIDYAPSVGTTKTIRLKITGTSVGDTTLLTDAIKGIEKLLVIDGLDMFSQAHVEFIRHREEQTVLIEKWHLGGRGWEKDFWVRYDLTPPQGFPYKTLISVSPKEIFE